MNVKVEKLIVYWEEKKCNKFVWEKNHLEFWSFAFCNI